MFASCIKKMQHQPLMKGVTPPQVACKPSKRSSHDTGNTSASTTRTQVAPRERSARTEASSIARSPKAKLPKLQFPLPKTRRQTGGRATERDDEGKTDFVWFVRRRPVEATLPLDAGPEQSAWRQVDDGTVHSTSSLALRRLVGGKTSKLGGALVYKKGNVRPRVDEVDVHHELLFKATF